VKTVRSHFSAVMWIMGAKNRVKVAVAALRLSETA
jgi:DNA-binding NarL/FixJ family response regulator